MVKERAVSFYLFILLLGDVIEAEVGSAVEGHGRQTDPRTTVES